MDSRQQRLYPILVCRRGGYAPAQNKTRRAFTLRVLLCELFHGPAQLIGSIQLRTALDIACGHHAAAQHLPQAVPT